MSNKISQEKVIPTKQEMYDALVERQGANVVEKLSNASVTICGLGGLGSNIAICLARAGVGHLHLIDFDKVDISNLHRQQYFVSQLGENKTDALKDTLEKIAPYCHITTTTARITEDNAYELLSDCDVVCEAFDNPVAKAMLVNFVLEHFEDKYLLSSSGMAGFSSANTIKTRKITGRFYMCGDGVNDVNDGIGLVAPRVMTCAAHEALMAIRLLIGEKEA